MCTCASYYCVCNTHVLFMCISTVVYIQILYYYSWSLLSCWWSYVYSWQRLWSTWSVSASSTLTCSCELASKPHVMMLMSSVNVCMLCSSENIMIFVHMGCGFPILSFWLLPFCSPPVLMQAIHSSWVIVHWWVTSIRSVIMLCTGHSGQWGGQHWRHYKEACVAFPAMWYDNTYTRARDRDQCLLKLQMTSKTFLDCTAMIGKLRHWVLTLRSTSSTNHITCSLPLKNSIIMIIKTCHICWLPQ